MEKEKSLATIKEAIAQLSGAKDLNKIRASVAKLYAFIEALPSPQKEQAGEVLNALMAITDISEAKGMFKVLSDIVAAVEKELPKIKKYLPIKKGEYLKQYTNKRDRTYVNWRDQILTKEANIMEAEAYQSHLHEPWRYGK